jgi:CoA-transferase family III
MSYMSHTYTHYSVTNESQVRMGSANEAFVPYETFRASDGDVFVGVATNDMWTRFCTEFGLAELGDDARLRSIAGRCDYRDYVVTKVAEALASVPSAELIDRLLAIGVPTARERAQLVNKRDSIDFGQSKGARNRAQFRQKDGRREFSLERAGTDILHRGLIGPTEQIAYRSPPPGLRGSRRRDQCSGRNGCDSRGGKASRLLRIESRLERRVVESGAPQCHCDGTVGSGQDREKNVLGFHRARSASERFRDRALADGVQLAWQREVNHCGA